MKKQLVVFLLTLFIAASVFALDYTANEDRSKFTELPCRQDSGMLSPGVYAAIAKKMVQNMTKDIHFRVMSDPVVTLRYYPSNAPVDQKLICISWAYEGDRDQSGSINAGGIFTHELPVPVLQVLMRPDRSKAWVKVISYKPR